MTERDDTRPVWLTREQRDKIDAIYTDLPDYPRLDWEGDTLVGVVAAWDAAPADAEQAITDVFGKRQDWSDAVLAALGHPA